MNFVITDIETTGGTLNSNKITEIAIFKHNGIEVIDEYSTLVNPKINIPDFIINLTGIDNSMVVNAPTFNQVAKKILEFTKDCIFVAHNVSFDYGIIKNEFKNLGYEFNLPRICTVQASRNIIPGLKSYKLEILANELGVKINGRHRAVGDAKATSLIFSILLKKNKKKLFEMIKTEVNYKMLKLDF
jgi:DNA polymerase III subunit epsilon